MSSDEMIIMKKDDYHLILNVVYRLHNHDEEYVVATIEEDIIEIEELLEKAESYEGDE